MTHMERPVPAILFITSLSLSRALVRDNSISCSCGGEKSTLFYSLMTSYLLLPSGPAPLHLYLPNVELVLDPGDVGAELLYAHLVAPGAAGDQVWRDTNLVFISSRSIVMLYLTLCLWDLCWTRVS